VSVFATGTTAFHIIFVCERHLGMQPGASDESWSGRQDAVAAYAVSFKLQRSPMTPQKTQGEKQLLKLRQERTARRLDLPILQMFK
jgi:hypothetical protein